MTELTMTSRSGDEHHVSTSPLAGWAMLVGRVMLSLIFLLSGIAKVTAPAAMIGFIKASGLPFAPLALAIAAFIEIAGGVALIIGFRTRLVAIVLAGFSIVTAITFLSNFADQNMFLHFFKNVAMAGGLLQVAATGAGRLSLDARRR